MPTKGIVARWIISLTLITLLILWIGSEDIILVLSSADFFLLGVAILVHLIATSITAWRIGLLLPSENKVSFRALFTCNLGGMFLSDFTPARAGYLVTPLLLKRYGIEPQESLRSILFGQIFDFALRIILLLNVGLALALGFFGQGTRDSLLFYIFLSLVVLFAMTSIFSILAMNLVPKPLHELILKTPMIGTMYKSYASYSAESKFPKRIWAGAIAITILGWLVTAFRWILVGKALGIEIPLFWYLFLFPAISAISFIPFSIAGVGVVETSFGLTFWILGKDPADAIIFSMTDRATSIVGDAFGIPAWLRLPPEEKSSFSSVSLD